MKLIIANVVALISSMVLVYSASKKEKKQILIFQCIQYILQVISNLILGVVPGAIIGGISSVRNYLCYKNIYHSYHKVIISVLIIFLSIKFNNIGIMVIFPILSVLVYCWLLDVKDVIILKIIVNFSMFLWVIYDIYIGLYSDAIFSIIYIFVNSAVLIKMLIDKYKQTKTRKTNVVFPNYKEGLVNVIGSIEKYYGFKSKHNSLKELDTILKEKKAKNIVLVLFDGLGYTILKRNKRLCPNLNKYLVRSISSTFPSTTMAARTTIESGLTPIEHGWLGWDMYFKKFDNVITLTKNYVADTKEKITDYHIARTLMKYKSLVDKVKEKEGYNANKIALYLESKKYNLNKTIKKIQDITNNGLENYIYLYINEPDHTFHKAGVNGIRSKYKLFYLDRKFKKLCKSLDDTTIIALADHGHINVEYITLSDYPNITKMLDGNLSIDKRACSFRVKKGYKNAFKRELKKVLKDDFIILSSKEVDEQKLFGEGIKNKYYNDALGDFLAISISNKSIRLNKIVHKHKSSHSGLTEDEMLVPLIVYKGD